MQTKLIMRQHSNTTRITKQMITIDEDTETLELRLLVEMQKNLGSLKNILTVPQIHTTMYTPSNPC